jgi:hypothetical protein
MAAAVPGKDRGSRAERLREGRLRGLPSRVALDAGLLAEARAQSSRQGAGPQAARQVSRMRSEGTSRRFDQVAAAGRVRQCTLPGCAGVAAVMTNWCLARTHRRQPAAAHDLSPPASIAPIRSGGHYICHLRMTSRQSSAVEVACTWEYDVHAQDLSYRLNRPPACHVRAMGGDRLGQRR